MKTLTVTELIKELQKFPGTMKVGVRDNDTDSIASLTNGCITPKICVDVDDWTAKEWEYYAQKQSNKINVLVIG